MKNKLIELAKEKGFTSKFFTDKEWKYSSKEESRYFLWMCELQMWLVLEFELHIDIGKYNEALEAGLIEVLNLIEYESK